MSELKRHKFAYRFFLGLLKGFMKHHFNFEYAWEQGIDTEESRNFPILPMKENKTLIKKITWFPVGEWNIVD